MRQKGEKMNKTNIELLHKHALGQTGGRGSGKTYYQCSLVIGAAELGNDVIVVLPALCDREYIEDIIRQILIEHKVAIMTENKNKMVLENGSRILFYSYSKHKQFIEGRNKEKTAIVEMYR